MKRMLWCTLFVVATAACGVAQTIKVPESWDKLAGKADEVVNVNMDHRMLQFASKFMDKEGDAEGKQLISKLNGIYVRSLEFKSAGAFTGADVEPIRAQMQGPEWSHFVDVENRTDKERVAVYVKTVNSQTVGMVILVEEPTELTFVHLDGPIDPDDLDELGGNFGIPKDIHVRQDNTVAPDQSKSTTRVKK